MRLLMCLLGRDQQPDDCAFPERFTRLQPMKPLDQNEVVLLTPNEDGILLPDVQNALRKVLNHSGLESFPLLLQYLISNGLKVPGWLRSTDACPWPDRAQFLADQQSPRMKELRSFLAETVPFQAKFAALRLERALPKMLEAAPIEEREKIRKNFYRVAAEPDGLYALVDYVNFKGEGTLATERYQGKGWGLLQVLERMPDRPGDSTNQFSEAAAAVLRERVHNAPPNRHEERWLSGWIRRVNSYNGS